MSLQQLSDKEVSVRLLALVRREREATVEVLLYLIELDRRKLYLEEGYSSLFTYCTEKLRYSESAAHRRIASARCVRQFEELSSLLLSGELSLTTLSLIAKELTAENKARLLSQVCGKSRREVEDVIAGLSVVKKTPEKIRPITVQVREPAVKLDAPLFSKPSPIVAAAAPTEEPSAEPAPSVPVERTERRYALSFSVSKELKEKIDQVRWLLSNKLDSSSLEATLGTLVDEYLRRHAPKERAPQATQVKEEAPEREQ